MPEVAPVTGHILVFEDVDLVTLGFAENLGHHFDIAERITVGHGGTVVPHHHDRRERQRIGGVFDALDLDYVAGFDFGLLTAGANDGVHRQTSGKGVREDYTVPRRAVFLFRRRRRRRQLAQAIGSDWASRIPAR